jgi:hypothetical protein
MPQRYCIESGFHSAHNGSKFLISSIKSASRTFELNLYYIGSERQHSEKGYSINRLFSLLDAAQGFSMISFFSGHSGYSISPPGTDVGEQRSGELYDFLRLALQVPRLHA